jgi:putative endonuclease
MYYVYILWSEQLQKYYVGSSNNLNDRMQRHNAGQGKYTSKGVPWILKWSITFPARGEAFRLEQKIKSRGIEDFWRT